MKIGKYKFDSIKDLQTKIDALGIVIGEDGNKYATHKHTVVELGNIILKAGEYDEDFNEIVAPVFSKYWHVDVLWVGLEADEDGTIDHPYGWKSKSVDIDGNGVHAFFGADYESLKF